MERKCMSRLANYLAIITLDESQLRHGSSAGIVKKRFPENEWSDAPFPQNIQMFCLPHGWTIVAEKRNPMFFVTTLTDLTGAHQFLFCLQTYEAMEVTSEDDDDNIKPNGENMLQVYKPVVIAFISSFPFVEFFRTILSKILTYDENKCDVERLIADVIGNIVVNNSFRTIYLERQSISVWAPKESTLQITTSRVYLLVKYLGSIHNLILLFRCLMSEQNIVFHSCSLNRLFNATYALQTLLYPLEYAHTLVSILPESLIDYLESPTPFLMGILSSSLPKIPSVECALIDLDQGEFKISPSIDVPEIPEPYNGRLIERLKLVLYGDVQQEDNIVQDSQSAVGDDFEKDKKIRACFLLFFVEFLRGYRTCLEVVRLYEKPFIVFHQAAFLGLRQLFDPFSKYVTSSQMFQVFVSNRGLPYRESDYFDKLMSKHPNVATESTVDKSLLEEIVAIFKYLEQNEKQCCVLPDTNWVAKPKIVDQLITDKLLLHLKKVDQMIHDTARSRSATPESSPKKIIKERENCWENTTFINHRRLVVLEKCIEAIFDKRIADASKMILAAEFSLKIPEARIFLCRSLEQFAIPVSKATLSAEQFDLVVRLLNFSLDQESTNDEYGVAYACVRLSFLFCKVLSQGVFQFVYTCIQNHPVWKCSKFWETCFYHDVHLIIEKHYDCGLETKNATVSEKNLWNLMNENSSLMMVAEHLKNVEENNEEDEHEKHKETEDEILFSQAKHYINLIVLLRTPIEVEPVRSKVSNNNKSEELNSNSSQNQLYPYIDTEQKNSTEELIKWISKLVYGMCSSANLKSTLIHRLLNEIRHMAYMQVENLQIIQEESKRDLSVAKKAIIKPISYLPNEKILMEGLPCLFIDHKTNLKVSDVTQPAQGVLLLTNYCIYFKGNSCEYGEETEICVPLMSIVKKMNISEEIFKEMMKQITYQESKRFHSPIMIRTINFQTVSIFFEEQVNPLSIESFWSKVVGVRWPTSFQNAFLAYSNDNGMLTLSSDSRRSSKVPSFLRDITLNKSKKDFRTGMESTFSLSTSPRRQTAISQIDDHKKTSCFLSTNHSYLADYARLMKRSDIRLSHANKFYDISKTLPSCILVPTTVKDDFLFKIRKIYKYNRLPAITWANPSGQLLLRGSSINSSNIMHKLKNQAFNRSDLTSNFSYSRLNFLNKNDFEVMSTDAANQEDYFNQVIQAIPSVNEVFYHSLQLDSFNNLVSNEQFNSVSDRIKAVAGKLEKNHKPAMEIVHGVLSKPDVLQTSSKNEKPIELAEGDKRKLFMLSDKTNVKVLGKNENVQVVQIKYPSISDQKAVFKQLCRSFNIPSKSKLHISFYESGWLQKISEIIRLSVSMCTMLNTLRASVSLCIEDGWDATCQLMSLTQLISDPYYRTIEGFGLLIDKEWAAFGYHFSSRNNCSVSSTNNDVIPVFLIFLDAVHQIMVQFPTCFEFNDYFLRFIAYHSTTAYFRTFVLDCESDRVQLDYMYPDSEKNKNIWKYIKKINDETTKFKNWSYSTNTDDVITPSTSIASMEIWSFYVERLQTNGTVYDIRKRNENEISIKESPLICTECSPLIKEDRIKEKADEICTEKMVKSLSSPHFSVDDCTDESRLYSEYIQEAYRTASLFSLLLMRESSPPANESTNQVQVAKKSEPVFVYQGYLTKKGARTNMRKERWFALDSVNRKLLCFDRPNDRIAKHVIELPDIKNVSTEVGTNKSSLVITTLGKTHVLSSSSVECINEWKRNIEKLLFE